MSPQHYRTMAEVNATVLNDPETPRELLLGYIEGLRECHAVQLAAKDAEIAKVEKELDNERARNSLQRVHHIRVQQEREAKQETVERQAQALSALSSKNAELVKTVEEQGEQLRRAHEAEAAAESALSAARADITAYRDLLADAQEELPPASDLADAIGDNLSARPDPNAPEKLTIEERAAVTAFQEHLRAEAGAGYMLVSVEAIDKALNAQCVLAFFLGAESEQFNNALRRMHRKLAEQEGRNSELLSAVRDLRHALQGPPDERLRALETTRDYE